jgi:hypothetical protein
MGYIGSVNLFGEVLRVSSCSLNSRQAIEHPDVIDGTVDWTLYQLKGIESEGDVAFPVMSAGPGNIQTMFDFATNRDTDGELLAAGDIIVSYGHDNGRRFSGCKINTFELRAVSQEGLTCTMGIWGTTVDYSGSNNSTVLGPPTRVLSWADIVLSGSALDTCDIREFTFTISNNLQRNYTFCPASGYFPNNISTGKRNINGTITFQGFAPTDVPQADQNRNKINPDTSITMDVAAAGFSVNFLNVIYEYQTIEAQPAVLTSTVNWYAHADGGGEAIS